MMRLFDQHPTAFILLGLVLALLALLAIFKPPSSPGVQAKPLLTKAEQQFMTKLEIALPQYRVLTQVAMGALLQPDVRIKDQKRRTSARWSYSQKIVDFVIADRHDGRVLAIVELDDKSHVAEKDAKRDRMLESAGYKVVRFSNGRYLSIEDIRNAFALVFAAG